MFDRVRTLLQTEVSDYQMYPGRSEPAAFIASPIFNTQGRVVGFVALELNNEQVFRVFKDYSGLGETGEAMVAMRHGQRLHVRCSAASRPRARSTTYRGRSAMNKATAMQKAVQGQRGYGEAIDYRGQTGRCRLVVSSLVTAGGWWSSRMSARRSR